MMAPALPAFTSANVVNLLQVSGEADQIILTDHFVKFFCLVLLPSKPLKE